MATIDEAPAHDDIELIGEKKLTWFDVSTIGSGEFLAMLTWGFIVYIASIYGLMWGLIGFGIAAVIVLVAWWLYREIVTAVPEAGWIQSWSREAGLFSLGTSYFILFVPVYAAFMWLEFAVATAFLQGVAPGVDKHIWPLVLIGPLAIVNLAGFQITAKLQATLVSIMLVLNVLLGILIWTHFNSSVWSENWAQVSAPGVIGVATIAGLWIALMAGALEAQAILVDDWDNFKRSRDVGMPLGLIQLFFLEFVVGIGIMGVFPIGELFEFAVPPVSFVEVTYGKNLLYVLAFIFVIIGNATTFNVYFMTMGKTIATYAHQGAIPRVFGRYSTRGAVPWVAILFLIALALAGAYWTGYEFIVHLVSAWAVTLYAVVALCFLGMRRNKQLERPVVARFGTALAIALLVASILMAYGVLKEYPAPSYVWFGVVALVAFYDYFIVPRTARGKRYRASVLQRRTSAARL
ncbi:MAG: APC family permease [Actinobacteria bacterium]|nr:APC family permease [Actinomycetota bacterium]